MKKIIALIAVSVFAIGLVGCNSTKPTLNENEDNSSITKPIETGSSESKNNINSNISAPEENDSPSTTESNVISKNNDIEDNIDSNTNVPEENNAPSTMELKMLGSLQYYLYTPSDPTSNLPLIVYLHGGTNKKADVTELLTTDGFPKYLYDGFYGDLRAYVVIPKLDNRYKGWIDIADQINDLIKSINTNYAVDMNKISLTGHSMGGTGTYQLQVKLPNTFACIAPMSGSIQNNEANLTALSKTKIWAFVGTDDTIVSPDSSRTIINELKEKGATAKITELDGATHFDVPSLAYKNDDLIQWLVNCGE